MPENIFEHTTSIVGLTCKPLAILSETISPQEMSRTQGGNGCGEKKKEEDPIDWNDRPGVSDFINSHLGSPPGEPLPQPPPISGPQGPQVSPATWYSEGEPVNSFAGDPDSSDPDDPFRESDPFNTIAEGDSLSQDESGFLGDGDCGDGGDDGDGEDDSSWLDDIWDWLTGDEDDEDDDSSGLDGMEGDFDLSENEMFT